MPIRKPSGAWVPYPPKEIALFRLSGPSEASCWRKLMHHCGDKGRTQLEEMGYRVEWVEGATCTEYEGS